VSRGKRETGRRRRRRRRREGKTKRMVGPHLEGGNGGPPEMEGGRGNLEGPKKWRVIWRSCWSCVFSPNL
jgi:hypothetical protein